MVSTLEVRRSPNSGHPHRLLRGLLLLVTLALTLGYPMTTNFWSRTPRGNWMPRKSSNARKTTIYKLRPVSRLTDLIVDKYVDNPAFEIDRSLHFAEQPCVLISGQFAVQDEADWCQLVRNYVETSISLRNISASAALIVQLNENILALTYGLGRHFLKPTHIEQNFGLKFALTVLNPDRIREVTRNILDEKARVDRNTTPQGQTIESFTIEDYGEIVSRIIGEANVSLTINRNTASRVTVKGSDALFLPVGKARADLHADLNEIARVSTREHAAPELAFLENLRAIKKTDPMHATLDEQLAGAFEQNSHAKPSLAYPTIATDDLIEARSYRIRIAGSDEIVDELTLDDIQRPLTERTVEQRLHALYSGTIQAFSDDMANDACSSAISLNRWIACDVPLGTRQFFFHAGSWFEVGDQYATSVNRRVDEILRRQSTTNLPPWPDSIKKEIDYNLLVSQDSRFTCLDTREIKGLLHRRKGIEPCDLFGPDNELIHVKAAERSSPLSHLFNQGRNAAELLLNDSVARQEFIALVREYGGGRVVEPNWRPRKIIFAIASKKDRSTSDHLFTFAKVALLRCVGSLTDRIAVEVIAIQYAD